jgi:RNA polymerase sporulation-specific sigma factor
MTPDLLRSAVKGDARSITAIVEQYTPLVQKIVNKYAWMAPSHSREDLVQEGLLGVVKAIQTFDIERGNRLMTWVYPNVRIAVQSAARKENKRPKFPLSLEQSDWGGNLEDTSYYEVKDDFKANFIQEIILAGCGALDSKRANIVCDRFGLLGRKPMRQGDVAKKYGLTKQAVQSHLAGFHKKIRKNHPELEAFIK